MNSVRRLLAATGIFFAVIFLFSCTSEQEKLKSKISREEKSLINDSTRSLRMDTALTVIADYLEYVKTYPKDTLSESYLLKAADVANGIKDYNRSVEILDRLLKEYPNSKRIAQAIFMQAFIYETNIRNVEKAKEKYKDFLNRFPDHAMAEGAKASLNQLEQGLSDEDMVRMFMQKDSVAQNQ
ncbi:MAG: tetratricopeptide repeat protein [Bacteroidia bacterium]